LCSLLVSRDTGSAIGTVRLVLADPEQPESSFPIQKVCRQPLLADGMLLSLKTAAEISRFAISRKFRFVPESFVFPAGRRRRKQSMEDARFAPTLTLGLMKATLLMSREQGVTDWLAVMEPSLLRLLARFGICFQPVGPLVAYHGMRQPCYANIRRLLEGVREERPDVWKYVTDGCPA
jgi:N-acyl amino acid synthase of PEP-CTERM/exosortase system